MLGPHSVVRAAIIAIAVACAACTVPGGRGPPASPPASGANRPVITVGSFNFPESVLLAHLYADALAGRGYPVRVLPDLGTRELVGQDRQSTRLNSSHLGT